MSRQVPSETVLGGWLRLKGLANQLHVGFFGPLPTFPPVAGRASRYQIVPRMRPTLATGNHVVDGQEAHLAAAILAGVIVTAEDLSFGQCNSGAWSFDHVLQLDNGRDLKGSRVASYEAPAVQEDFCLPRDDKGQCPLRVADVQWFIIHI